MKRPDFLHIKCFVEANVAHIVLSRPDRLNVLGFGPDSSRHEIVLALEAADADPEVGCVLISAQGKAFSAGGDISGLPESPTPAQDMQIIGMVDAFNGKVRQTRKPVIAAVQGLCLGAALGFIAQCDLVVASKKATFGLPEGRFGHPGGSDLVPVIGQAWAKFLIFSGESISAQKAAQIGLVFSVVEDEHLAGAATALATRLARMPSDALVLNKQSIDRAAEAGGRASARIAGRTADVVTKSMSVYARAPDGRFFKDILAAEGTQGLKKSKIQQYETSWLDQYDIDK